MKKALKHLFLFTFLILLGTSCANKKKMIYFQGIDQEVFGEAQNYELVFRTGDFLMISVSGANPDAAIPFNPITTQIRENFTGQYATDNPQTTGYTVGTDGMIDFPIIGKIEVAGKNREQLEEELKEKLNKHLQYPGVRIRLRNFKVAVLGDVGRPGTFTISNERLTLPEALGIAGDLNITAKRKNILVIRDEDGEKKQYRVDLTGTELFSSPVYYLKQNDIVYVEPNQAKLNASKFSPVYSVIISVTSLILTTIVIIRN